MGYLPVFLELSGHYGLVVGDRGQAAARVRALVGAGARVRVVASEPSAGLVDLCRDSSTQASLFRRDYRGSDMVGVRVVFLCEPRAGLEVRLRTDAKAESAWLSVCDDAPASDFVNGAVLRRGCVTVAVASDGASPALSIRLRDELAGHVGEHHARAAGLLGRLRPLAAEHISESRERAELYRRILDNGLLRVLAEGSEEELVELLEESTWPGFEVSDLGLEKRR